MGSLSNGGEAGTLCQQLEAESYLSLVFLVPKADGSWIPVVNLKPPSQYIINWHFKMESIRTVKGLLQEGDWLTRLDLKDLSAHSPLPPEIPEIPMIWEFKVMPFGLASAPCTFTKLLKSVVAVLRRLGIRVVLYLDDITNSVVIQGGGDRARALSAIKDRFRNCVLN